VIQIYFLLQPPPLKLTYPIALLMFQCFNTAALEYKPKGHRWQGKTEEKLEWPEDTIYPKVNKFGRHVLHHSIHD
jgi:hypothetical protein